MPPINVTNVEVLANPAPFTSPFQFQITFECIPPGIRGELEWKLIYVGSADDEKYDQVLDSVLVGPVALGTSKFVFQVPAPDPSRIPHKDLLEVTVILLTCSYLQKEFIRVGYYVNNELPGFMQDQDQRDMTGGNNNGMLLGDGEDEEDEEDEDGMQENGASNSNEDELQQPEQAPRLPPPDLKPEDIVRCILTSSPRVTRFPIEWDDGVVM